MRHLREGCVGFCMSIPQPRTRLESNFSSALVRNVPVHGVALDTWALVARAGHVRTVPIPAWVKNAIDEWTVAAGITHGVLFGGAKLCGDRTPTFDRTNCSVQPILTVSANAFNGLRSVRHADAGPMRPIMRPVPTITSIEGSGTGSKLVESPGFTA